ncbi:MAG: hypothetical protein ACHQM6_00155 [Candidatus Kapaibacterium sp.]
MRNSFSLATGSGKKKYTMSYSFHLDTGDMAHKAGEQIQHAAEKGYKEVSRFVQRKYRTIKVKRTLSTIRKTLSKRIKRDFPVDLISLKF